MSLHRSTAAAPHDTARPPSRRLRALIVEDSQDDALLDATVLEDAGYQVHWDRVQDADEMTSALAKTPWDLVLCDHALPRFDSFEALTTLAASQQSGIPMIIVSGAIGEETAAAVILRGAADFVNKNNLGRLPTATVTVLRNARRRRAAARTEAQFRSAFEDSAFGSALVRLDGEAGRLVRVNRSLCGTIRLRRSELSRTRLHALVHEDDRAALERGLRELSEGRRPVYRAELRYPDSARKARWFPLRGVTRRGRRAPATGGNYISAQGHRRADAHHDSPFVDRRAPHADAQSSWSHGA
jgi:PAS domain S-box-containing protein